MTFFKTKYKIVPDSFAGYEIRYKHWYMPFWMQLNYCNTWSSYESAEKAIKLLLNPKIYTK